MKEDMTVKIFPQILKKERLGRFKKKDFPGKTNKMPTFKLFILMCTVYQLHEYKLLKPPLSLVVSTSSSQDPPKDLFILSLDAFRAFDTTPRIHVGKIFIRLKVSSVVNRLILLIYT